MNSDVLPLRIGILAPGNPDNIKTYSGIPYFMVRALRKKFQNISYLSNNNLPTISRKVVRKLDRVSRSMFRRGYRSYDSRTLLKAAARVDRQIQEEQIDVVLAVNVDRLVALLKTDVPIVSHSDATFALMERYYPAFKDLWGFCRDRGDRCTSRALSRSTVCSFASEWAANSAVRDYGVDPDKVRVLPYGANLFSPPPVEQALAEKCLGSACQLLFIGKEWERKGGPMVFSTFQELLRRGIDVNLVVVGCDPDLSHEKLEIIPFLNKKVPEELERFLQLWQESAFFFMPSHQEAFGIVYAEAAANGVPVIARNTGGVSSCIEHGVSGCLLPEGADAGDYADAIEALWSDPEQYETYARNARTRFERTLNWDAWAEQMASIMFSIISSRELSRASSHEAFGSPLTLGV